MAEERRLHRRFTVQIKASISLLAPDQTFTPVRYLGEILDISESGLRVRIPSFPHEDYSTLLHGSRFARIRAALPGIEPECHMHGDVKWIDYRTTVTPPECHLGICFGPLTPLVRGALTACLGALEKESATA